MILRNVTIVGENSGPSEIRISGGRIAGIRPLSFATAPGPVISFDGALAFPGLINSHDHLHFNLYPPLGHRLYHDYLDWSADIHRRDAGLIRTVETVPLDLRLRWGLYKNLLAGVTTVMHHGRFYPLLRDSLIGVIHPSQSLHSPGREKHWRARLLLPLKHWRNFRKTPVVIHVGEGKTDPTRREIAQLLRGNLWGRPLIGVHALAISAEQARKFAALVWCPASNLFLYGQTAPVERLQGQVPILFGTDSTLSGDWNFWEHLRLARRLGKLDDPTLFRSVSETPARVWRIPAAGRLETGSPADLLVARRSATDIWEAFFALNPEDLLLIFRRGQPLLIDSTLLDAEPTLITDRSAFSRVAVNGRRKWVRGDLPNLLAAIRRHYPAAQFPISTGEARHGS